VDRPPPISAPYSLLALAVILLAPPVLNAQAKDGSDGSTGDTAALLKAIDRLVEQNRRLEEQNRQLIDQINALRQALASTVAALANAHPPDGATVNSGPAAAPAIEPSKSAPNSEPSPTIPPVERPPADPSASPNPQSGAGPGAAGPNQNAGQNQSAASDNANGSSGSPVLFGEWNPGDGFTVARTKWGQLDLSGYMVMRYLNQLPPHQTGTDHLGRPVPVQARQDFQFHRVLLYAKGWLFTPKFNYLTVIWTVNDTTQVAVGGALWYNFNKNLSIGGGYTALPGTQSMQGSHPYWPSYDRVMADEFFRPFYTQGVFGTWKVAPRLVYRFAVGNNLSLLGITANQLSRDLSAGGSLTWLPTTGEFGPRGAFGDYEEHEKLATRFNIAFTRSREPRFTPEDEAAANTTLRLADSLNVFDTGTFAPGVTVTKVTYEMVSSAAGIKYHGFWLQGEGYARRLRDFVATGPLPISVVRDFGFYAQAAYMVVPKRVELYGSTSYVFSDYGKPKEFIAGGNYYPWNTRNIRVNLQLIKIDHSPVNSTFGFYSGQITGTILAFGMTVLY
jgi:hypothetical protein